MTILETRVIVTSYHFRFATEPPCTPSRTPAFQSSKKEPAQARFGVWAGLSDGFKISAMYSVDHRRGKAIQQNYDLLTELLTLGGQFTFGFVNHASCSTAVLYPKCSYPFEVAFPKGNWGGLFSDRVTLKDFKRALAVLGTRPTVIAEREASRSFWPKTLLQAFASCRGKARKRG